jgi:hypothetical protein
MSVTWRMEKQNVGHLHNETLLGNKMNIDACYNMAQL